MAQLATCCIARAFPRNRNDYYNCAINTVCARIKPQNGENKQEAYYASEMTWKDRLYNKTVLAKPVIVNLFKSSTHNVLNKQALSTTKTKQKLQFFESLHKYDFYFTQSQSSKPKTLENIFLMSFEENKTHKQYAMHTIPCRVDV